MSNLKYEYGYRILRADNHEVIQGVASSPDDVEKKRKQINYANRIDRTTDWFIRPVTKKRT